MFWNRRFNNNSEADSESLADQNEQEQYKDSPSDPKLDISHNSEDITVSDSQAVKSEDEHEKAPKKPNERPHRTDDDDKPSPPPTPHDAPLPEIVNEPTKPESQERGDETIYAFRWEPVQAPKDSNKKEEKKSKAKSKDRRSSGLFFPTAVMGMAFLLAVCVLGSAFIAQSRNVHLPTNSQSIPSAEQTETPSKIIYIREDSDGELLTPQEIYSYCAPSVVSIKGSSQSAEGIGTGFVISSDGYIATANHVVANMSSLSVIFEDGRSFSATVVGSDEMCDLALLKIECDGLTPLVFGNSSELMVGEEIVAIGTPASIEFSGSLARGDVSFVNRTVFVRDEESGALKKKMFLLQTSAPLNPGNSGGPVLDMHGRVVGIVTMKLGDGFDGISFAIPASPAADIFESIKGGSEIKRDSRAKIAVGAPLLGIVGKSYSDGSIFGVAVTDFTNDSSDAARKLRRGDVIVSVNNIPVTSSSELSEQIRKLTPYDKVKISLWRNSQLLSFDVELYE